MQYLLAPDYIFLLSHHSTIVIYYLIILSIFWFSGAEAFAKLCDIFDLFDDFAVGAAVGIVYTCSCRHKVTTCICCHVVSILGHHRELSEKIKTQQTLHLSSASLEAMKRYVSSRDPLIMPA